MHSSSSLSYKLAAWYTWLYRMYWKRVSRAQQGIGAKSGQLTQRCVCHVACSDPRHYSHQVQAVHCLGHAAAQLSIAATKVCCHPSRALLLQPGNGHVNRLHRPVLRLFSETLHVCMHEHTVSANACQVECDLQLARCCMRSMLIGTTAAYSTANAMSSSYSVSSHVRTRQFSITGANTATEWPSDMQIRQS